MDKPTAPSSNTTASWSAVRALFNAALSLPAPERQAFMLTASADVDVRAEVLSLMAHADADDASLGAAAIALAGLSSDGATSAPAQAMKPGLRLGQWRLVEALGMGGMGEVWLAERADGAYAGEAAIKVLKRGMDSDALLGRFAQEQRVLARLNHPHIARLFDAGLTLDHRPYFVMERVRGKNIDVASGDHLLEGRLGLFLQLADAVAYAHRSLLVHRDLKPSNVLVTPDGQVKLLDFGIAKALEGDDSDAITTQQGQRPFTPQYASPEQVRGEPVGTTTDIYSLGVLLYQMLTGTRPTGRHAVTPMEAARSVLEDEPTRPSKLTASEAADPQWQRTRRRLAGDMDKVLLKALEKLPDRRYASVDAMATDVRAFLEGYPVSARAASPVYVLARFVMRNRWALVAAGLGGLGLVTGLVAAVVQGRGAVAVGAVGMGAGLALALAQARMAAQARNAAQARFEDLRQLAHAVLFDYHNLVEPLAGATPVRQRLVNDAIVYLDRLAKAAPDDRRVLLEMGMAHHTVGLVQRNGFRRPHLGDTKGAMRSFARAIALLARLVKQDERDEASAFELALALSARAGVLGEDLQLAPARRDLAEAAALFTRHLTHDTPDLRHRLELARTHLRLADVLKFCRLYDDALVWVEEARRVLVSLAALQPEHLELPHVWVWVHNLESFMARENHDWRSVIAAEEKVWALLIALQAKEPDNARFLEDLAGSAQWQMATYGRLGEVELVARWAEEAVSRWRHAARTDPEDRNARRRYLNTLSTSGWAFVEAGAAGRAVTQLDGVRTEVDALAARFNGDFDTRNRHAAFVMTCALAHAAASQGTARPSAQARAVVQALQRDFADTANASVLATALPPLQDALQLVETPANAGNGPWLQQARDALQQLGVR